MNDYSDIINTIYPFPSNHPKMKKENRASQFAPFAALTGYDEQIEIAQIEKKEKIILDDNLKEEINFKIKELEKRISEKDIVKITFSSNNDYQVVISSVKKIDHINKKIIFDDGNIIKIDSIIDISGDIFS